MSALYDRAMATPREAFVEATRASQFVSITPHTTTIGALSASLFMKQQQQKQHGQMLAPIPIAESVRSRLTLVDSLGLGLASVSPSSNHRCPAAFKLPRAAPAAEEGLNLLVLSTKRMETSFKSEAASKRRIARR